MVAWIGSRTVPLSAAIEQVAKLLENARCPVFSLNSDIHGYRSLIALAERVGATYDHVNGRDLVHEVALHTDVGGFFATATEVRRRADLIVVVGDVPVIHHDLLMSLAASKPDLSGGRRRRWFQVNGRVEPTNEGRLPPRLKAVELGSPDFPFHVVLGILRAALAGRKTSSALANADALRSDMANARFPVFMFSRLSDVSSLAMLQGMLADINKTQRATALFLPADDDAWGLVLASTWMTGFPPRTGFSTGSPVYDPWLCDIDRMIEEKEADLHVWVSEGDEAPPTKRGPPKIALVRSEKPVAGAAVTIRIGKAGVDHDGVVYSSRIGTLKSVVAEVPSDLPSVSAIVGQIQHALQGEGVTPC
jgi:Formylmethanofuran dehydrogenase subunit B